MSKSNYIIPIFVPHLGCPHDCVFCNQREITGVRNDLSKEEVLDKIEDYLSTIPKSARRIEVAFYGGSFTGIDPRYQLELLSAAKMILDKEVITGIRLSTRPDYIDEEILERLQEYGVGTIELGVQSLDDNVLSASNRGHSREDVKKAVSLIKNYNFKLGLQVMPGLPNSTRTSDLDTGTEVIELSPDFVRIYPTLVIKNTELAELYKSGRYQPLSLEEAVDISAELLEKFKRAGINVIRVGLQPSEGVNAKEVLAGPFHPSFRQLVESRLLLNKIEGQIRGRAIDKLELTVNSKDVSNLRGQRNSNLDYLYNRYQLQEIIIKDDDTLARGNIKIKFIF
jgi:radical SAM enzyme (TIGR01210 family)